MPLFLISVTVLSQDKSAPPDLPREEGSGHVIYTAVRDANGAKADLYLKMQGWFQDYFTNPAGVIKEKDDARAMIFGKHGFKIYRDINWGKKSTAPQETGLVKYQIKVIAKDNRYKYKIDDIYLHKSPKFYIEGWLDKSLPADAREQNYEYLRQVDQHMKELIESLHAAITAAAPAVEEEW